MELLYFGTPTCTQCRALKNSLKGIPYKESEEYTLWGVMSAPTLVLVDDDMKEIKRTTGFKTKSQLIEWLGSFLCDLK